MTRASQPTRLPADEMSPRVNHRQVARVLAGTGVYDSLSEQEQAQAIVREEWADRMTTLRSELDYAAQFSAAGESSSELDQDGNVVVHPARG